MSSSEPSNRRRRIRQRHPVRDVAVGGVPRRVNHSGTGADPRQKDAAGRRRLRRVLLSSVLAPAAAAAGLVLGAAR